MSIKDKPLKKCHSDKRITLDVIHNDIISEYEKEKSDIQRQLQIESNIDSITELKEKLSDISP